jgi:hypothetical protein
MQALSLALLLAFVLTGADQLTGRWQSPPSPTGSVTSVVFKADQSFEGFINRKPFTTGRYTLKDSIFSFTDNGCNHVTGTYKLQFFSNNDSMRFVPVEDSCTERKGGMSKLVLGRTKTVVP